MQDLSFKERINLYQKEINSHKEKIAQLEKDLKDYMMSHPAEMFSYIMEKESTFNTAVATGSDKTKIVRVCFDSNRSKTYDYEYKGKEEVNIGDYVLVRTRWGSEMSVEVLDIFEIDPDDAEYDYSPAFSSCEELEEYY